MGSAQGVESDLGLVGGLAAAKKHDFETPRLRAGGQRDCFRAILISFGL